jgi:hypothetical protein
MLAVAGQVRLAYMLHLGYNNQKVTCYSPNSPPMARPCTSLSIASRMGAAMPIWL